jgi:hypothetical protein
VQEQRFDPAERLRLRRERARRARRRRRLLLALIPVGIAVVAAGAVLGRGRGGSSVAAPAPAARPVVHRPSVQRPRPLPAEVRGVHVTMSLASLKGRLEQYLAVPGLNAVELDVKDESGRVAFVGAAPPLARATGAAGRYYDPRQAVTLARRHGVYLIGRVVAFEDPVTPERRPELAIRTSGGGIWHNRAGLAWANPYSRAYWSYLVAVASAAAKAGFDEIQLDYVRFPTDGDLSSAVFPGKVREPLAKTIARFVHFVSTRLRPLGVRVSADVFGLSATRDLGIGQKPRLISKYLDAVYPMVYPSHYGAGEYRLEDPSAEPGRTVAFSLRDFRHALRGRKTKVIPWLQDFSLGRTYSLEDVRRQIAAARHAHTAGYMLWNAGGLYTYEALTSP